MAASQPADQSPHRQGRWDSCLPGPLECRSSSSSASAPARLSGFAAAERPRHLRGVLPSSADAHSSEGCLYRRCHRSFQRLQGALREHCGNWYLLQSLVLGYCCSPRGTSGGTLRHQEATLQVYHHCLGCEGCPWYSQRQSHHGHLGSALLELLVQCGSLRQVLAVAAAGPTLHLQV